MGKQQRSTVQHSTAAIVESDCWPSAAHRSTSWHHRHSMALSQHGTQHHTSRPAWHSTPHSRQARARKAHSTSSTGDGEAAQHTAQQTSTAHSTAQAQAHSTQHKHSTQQTSAQHSSVQHSSLQHCTAATQHSTAATQHSTAQHSTVWHRRQHSAAQHSTAQQP